MFCRKLQRLAFFFFLVLPAIGEGFPKLERNNGVYRLLVDGEPYLVLGAQLHNSSGWPDVLNATWPAIRQLHANTIMVPVYWQAIEPQPGKYDFSAVDATLKGARENNVHLALLWFGSWKNGGMEYAPSWVKADVKTYPRVIDKDGHAVDALSPLSQKSAEADSRAFAALLEHLKETDSDRHTVILVQVENEAGTLGSDRDYSPMANQAFGQTVPEAVLSSLHKKPGTWEQVFGANAPEAFSSYYTARYINQVAAAGKAVLPLPMYVNVWPREQSGLSRPGFSSPSGGAVSWLLDMWKAIAPSIDLIGPDSYDTNAQLYLSITELYARPDNPLLVPETGATMAHARHMFYVFATPSALGISMFGVNPAIGKTPESHAPRNDDAEVAVNYRLLGPAIPALLSARDAGHLEAAVEEDGIANRELMFDDYDAVVRYGPVRGSYSGEKGIGNPDLSGRALVAQLAPNEFLIIGANANIVFSPKLGDAQRHVSYTSVEEGTFENGVWHTNRLLNGDETYFGLSLPHEGQTLRVKLIKY
jgi:Domain of unknown function (DUF5597)/Glycosyl hydrolases family 35